MRKNKRIVIFLMIVVLVASIVGCTAKPVEVPAYEERPMVKVATLKGPTGMGMAQLMEENEAKSSANQYGFTLVGAPDEIIAKISTGEVDIAAVPTNLAATLYQKTNGEVQVAAVNTLGVLSIMEKGNTIKSIADLKGKTIYATGQGSTPQYILEYILKANGLEVGKDVIIEYKQEHAELSTLAIAGEIEVAMLPEPFVTTTSMKNSEMKVALNLTEEWKKVSGTELSMGCLIVRKEFAENNKEAFENFLKEYKTSTEFINGDVDTASTMIEKFDIMPAAVAKKALPGCNIVYVDGDEMGATMEPLLRVFFEANPKSIGGKLPNEDFYYKK